MPKSFISILGTNDYLECLHKFPDGEISKEPVKYVQEDLIKKYCKDWTENDEIRIFLTKDAKEKNWLDNGHYDREGKQIQNSGLESRIKLIGIKSKILHYDINEGFNEEEIWEIFQSIYDSFKEDEEVIVDITHSFRSLPMLLITLLNFAKQVKKIRVLGIYYAAFENLGPIHKVREIPVDQRVAPVLDLTSFSQLQDWTNATYDFIRNANITSLKKLVQSSKKELTNTIDNKAARDVIVEIDRILQEINLCRGNYIIDYDFDNLKKNIDMLRNLDLSIRPLPILIDELLEKIKNFSYPGIENLVNSVEWCIEHNLFQQAITLLQETVITIILKKLDSDFRIRDLRKAVSNCFFIVKENIEKNNWHNLNKIHEKLTEKVLELDFVKKISGDYEYLSDIRNDINHGGFIKDSKPAESIKSRLRNSVNRLKPMILDFNEGNYKC